MWPPYLSNSSVLRADGTMHNVCIFTPIFYSTTTLSVYEGCTYSWSSRNNTLLFRLKVLGTAPFLSSGRVNVVTLWHKTGCMAEDTSRPLFRYRDNQTTTTSLYITSVPALTCNLRL
jgi:hypothetical protein